MIVAINRAELFADETGAALEALMTTVQPDWQTPDSPDVTTTEDAATAEEEEANARERVCSGAWYGSRTMTRVASCNLFPVWKAEEASGGSALAADALAYVKVRGAVTAASLPPALLRRRRRARSDAPRRVDRRPSKKEEEEEISFSSKKEEEEISFS
jgi:hypothetical protein